MRVRAFSTMMNLIILFPCFSVSGQENVRSSEPPELNEATFSTIRQAILLDPSEAQWEQIPWQPDLGEAVLEARKQDKPILLWMMNGHPCGMT